MAKERDRQCSVSDEELDECMTTRLPTANRYVIVAVIAFTTILFLIDWAIWGGNLFGSDGHFYMDSVVPVFPHLRIHHFHFAIGMWISAVILFVIMHAIRPRYCCDQTALHHLIETVLSVIFWFLIIGGLALFIRDLNDVIHAVQIGNFFPD